MPKDRTVAASDRLSGSLYSPYSSASESKTGKKIMILKLLQSVRDKKDAEEAKCSMCMETPHNAVLLKCSNLDKGCHTYMCHTRNPHSNCYSQFRKSPALSQALSCPQCGGEVNGWILLAGVREFMNSRPKRCPVETCEFTGNYLELEKHARYEHHRLIRPSVDHVCTMRLERERDLEALAALSLS